MITIYLYDEIFPGDAQRVLGQIEGVRGDLTVRINSPGGAVPDGLAIFNGLKRFHGNVTVAIDGLAASIASLIAMAGDRIQMAENALLMIHAPWTMATGNAADLRDTADVLDLHAEAMVTAYAAKSGKSRVAILSIMAAETWYSAAEAVAAGFADEVIDSAAMAAVAKFDLSKFKHPPLTRNMSMPTTTIDPPAPPPTATPAAPAPAVVASTSEEVVAQLRHRNMTLNYLFGKHDHAPAIAALHREVLADPALTVEQAGAKLLAKLAEGAEPVNGPNWNPGNEVYRGGVHYGENAHHTEFRAAAIDAILLRGGVRIATPHAAVRDLRGTTIADIGAMLLRQRGRSTSGMTRSEIIQAALTTSDLPNLLENVANKSVMVGFRENEVASHRLWTREGTLADFKTAKRVALSEAPGLAMVREHGEYTYGNLSDAAEPAALSTYGKILAISRQALINDDIGELTRTPQAMGQSAARLEADLVYAVLTSNPTMRDSVALFDAAHANLAGTGGAISVPTLGAARAMMRTQRGLGGLAYLNLAPRFLMVPAAQETAADQVKVAITPTKTSDVSPEWIRNLTVVADARLDASSTTAWYLAADPTAHDTIEVLRLDGEPVLLETNNLFERDELQMKVRIDVGAVALDWRGLTKNPGA